MQSQNTHQKVHPTDRHKHTQTHTKTLADIRELLGIAVYKMPRMLCLFLLESVPTLVERYGVCYATATTSWGDKMIQ